MTSPPMVPYRPRHVGDPELAARARDFFTEMEERRSVRRFSNRPVDRGVMEDIIRSASTAPSGAHRQPWCFVLVGQPAIKRRIRAAAEAEERQNYEGGRMPTEWRKALEPLGTDWRKPFLEIAPWLVVLFEERYGVAKDGSRRINYYVKESVGIAAGFFISAVHNTGLATLPHTPSPMAFLRRALGRPENERAFALFPVGHPAEDALVPDLTRKSLDKVMTEVTE